MLSNLRKALTPHHFFSTLTNIYSSVSSQGASMRAMLEKYPYIMQKQFNGQVVYCLRGESPEELGKAGALYPFVKDLWLSNTSSGDNTGSVCFSLLPEVPTIFYPSTISKSRNKEAYLYAFPLHGPFLLPGGPWRQIISPGVFPLPYAWRARKMLGVEPDKQVPGVDRVKLGPLQGEGVFAQTPSCHRFLAYLNTKEDLLIKPAELRGSEDHPQEFDISDTELTERFQDEIEAHYRSKRQGSLRLG